jgi:hypothetical protein
VRVGHELDTPGTNIDYILGSYEPELGSSLASAPGFVHGIDGKVAAIYFYAIAATF